MSILYTLTSFISCTHQEISSESQIRIDSSLQDQALVCLLTDAELEVRKAQLKKEIFAKAIKIEAVDDGYSFHFNDEDQLLSKLIEFIQAEKKCCPFFNYQVQIKSFDKGINLKISGPIGVKMMLKLQLDDLLEEGINKAIN